MTMMVTTVTLVMNMAVTSTIISSLIMVMITILRRIVIKNASMWVVL